MVVPVTEDGRIAMVVQYRYLLNKHSVEFPGGGIKKDDNAHRTAKKELEEETGFLTDNMVKIGEFESGNGILRDRCNVFLAYINGQTEPHPDETEEIEVILRYPDEIDRMVRNNDIWCGQTLAAWSLTRHFFINTSKK